MQGLVYVADTSERKSDCSIREKREYGNNSGPRRQCQAVPSRLSELGTRFR